MATNTTRLGLTKPSGSASPEEAVDIGVINTNMDAIDEWMGYILVNDGVTPATGDLYDGALVKERTSGIIWEARKNGGGTFDKVYVRYPFHISAYRTGGVNQASSTWPTFTERGFTSVDTTVQKNSSSANLGGTGGSQVIVPIKGIYAVRLKSNWAANATGVRALTLCLDSQFQTGAGGVNGVFNYTQEIAGLAGGTDTSLEISFSRLFNASQGISCGVLQSSGGNLAFTFMGAQVTLIDPVQ